MRAFYSFVYYLALPLVLLRMLWRSRLAPAYRQRLAERLGFYGPPARHTQPLIWVHAVSVGETLAAAPLIERLLQDYAQHTVLVTCTTPTGSERITALFGDRVLHVYVPWDLPGSVRRFLRWARPTLLIVMETELWPNMLQQSRSQGCRILLANARLSERSARGYGRLSGLTRQMLANIDCIACQGSDDARRFASLGATAAQLVVTGSIKFDLSIDATLRDAARALRSQWQCDQRPMVLAASTHDGEDQQILTAFASLLDSQPQALLILVPRHPERFAAVAALCETRGFKLQRRSSGLPPAAEQSVLLGDSMGELLLLLGTADVCVMGGSLVPHGGHNVLEPAAWGIPVLAGPHMFNFAAITELLQSAGALCTVADADELATQLQRLLQDSGQREQMGAAGSAVLAQNRGALQKLLAEVAMLLAD